MRTVALFILIFLYALFNFLLTISLPLDLNEFIDWLWSGKSPIMKVYLSNKIVDEIVHLFKFHFIKPSVDHVCIQEIVGVNMHTLHLPLLY